jgi:hypothetical protein
MLALQLAWLFYRKAFEPSIVATVSGVRGTISDVAFGFSLKSASIQVAETGSENRQAAPSSSSDADFRPRSGADHFVQIRLKPSCSGWTTFCLGLFN